MKGITTKGFALFIEPEASVQTKALVLEFIADNRNPFSSITTTKKGAIALLFPGEDYAKSCKQYIKDNS